MHHFNTAPRTLTAPPRYPPPRTAEVNVKNFRRGYAMWQLVTYCPMIVDMLLGDVPLPSGRYSEQSLGSSSFMAAAVYVASNKDLWEEVPGALQHLRRYRNSAEVYFLTQDLRRGHPFDMQQFNQYLTDGGWCSGCAEERGDGGNR